MNFLKTIFSITNDNNHKIWCVLGIKIKFKYTKKNNNLYLHKINGKVLKNPKIKGLNVKFLGRNAIVKILEPYKFIDSEIHVYDNAYIEIGATKYQYNKLFINADYSTNFNCKFGKNISCGELTIRSAAGYNIKIQVGEECAFSTGCLIQPLDGHFIIDTSSKKVLNQENTGIRLGNHCWLGRDVKISKNVSISDNTIVGMGAIVTKSFPESNIIIAGVPAKIIKRNVDWKR